MMKLFLFPHRSTKNRGCEALVLSIQSLISKISEFDICLLHDNINDDTTTLKNIIQIKYTNETKIDSFSITWILSQIFIKLIKKPTLFYEYLASIKYSSCIDGDIYISIGGDNYCYGVPWEFYGINIFLKKKNKKIIFWGCSIEPSSINKLMIEDLNKYDLIITRESITYNSLIESKLKTKVVLYPDPAFTLETVKPTLYNSNKENEVIGINISPLIINSEKQNNITLINYCELIDYIINNSDYEILLIPHVTDINSDDRIPLKYLFEKFKYTKRIKLLDGNNNSKVLKYYISTCKIFIGARTHSTIAAYSSCVPTLVVGYSVKAKGIAYDIFNTFENFVIPVQSLKTSTDLVSAYKWLLNNYTEIKNHLVNFMPAYIRKAESVIYEIKTFVK